MDTAFKEFETDLKDLKPKVREKALELAAGLVQKEGYDKGRALNEAITEAEAWFLDLEG